MSIQVLAYLVVIALMVVDFVTGTINGIAQREFASAKMREGLRKKFGSLVLTSLGLAIVLIAPIFAQYPDVTQLMGFDFATSAVGYMIMGFIGVMELGSIIENACKLNPDLKPAKFLAAVGMNDFKAGGTE